MCLRCMCLRHVIFYVRCRTFHTIHSRVKHVHMCAYVYFVFRAVEAIVAAAVATNYVLKIRKMENIFLYTKHKYVCILENCVRLDACT